jgi:hypothetical protein
MRAFQVSSALVLSLLVAACESSDTTTPQVDVDAALAQMASGGISSYTTAAVEATAGADVAIPSAPGANTASCGYDSGTSFFVCSPVTSNGITFSRQFQLLDATGAPLATVNPLTVAAIRSVIDVEGTTAPSGANQATLHIDRHEDATLSGIQSANRVLDGSSTQELVISTTDAMVTSNEASVTTTLQLPSLPSQKYPLGGKITTDGSLTISGSNPFVQEYQREITFNGTSIMTVKMTSGSTTLTCAIDLSKTSAPACS